MGMKGTAVMVVLVAVAVAMMAGAVWVILAQAGMAVDEVFPK